MKHNKEDTEFEQPKWSSAKVEEVTIDDFSGSVKKLVENLTENDVKKHVVLHVARGVRENSSIQLNLQHCDPDFEISQLFRKNGFKGSQDYKQVSIKEVKDLGFKVTLLVVSADRAVQTQNQLLLGHQKMIKINQDAILTTYPYTLTPVSRAWSEPLIIKPQEVVHSFLVTELKSVSPVQPVVPTVSASPVQPASSVPKSLEDSYSDFLRVALMDFKIASPAASGGSSEVSTAAATVSSSLSEVKENVKKPSLRLSSSSLDLFTSSQQTLRSISPTNSLRLGGQLTPEGSVPKASSDSPLAVSPISRQGSKGQEGVTPTSVSPLSR